ncbi:NUDIX domain-containing protein [Flavobacteriaceae bacterium]|nr:NUDIX domain-containing protein [Flavobacteriaceae bacterium]
MDEWIDLVDSKNQICGKALKSEAHRRGLAHRSIHLWLCNENFTEFIIQKRSINKDSYPGLWDVSVAGHISIGETPEQTAIRETQEELGIQLKEQNLQFTGINHKQKIHGPNFIDHEFQYIFLCVFNLDLEDLILQSSEVSQVQWISTSKLFKSLQDNPESFVERSSDYISLIKSKLRS